MDFYAVTLFLVMYYVRPQEWFGFLASLRPAQLTLAAGFITMFLRYRGVRWTDFVRTPHDWVMVAFFVYTVFTSPFWRDTFDELLPFAFMYFLVVQALSSMQRLRWFLYVWAGMVLFISTLALLSMVGIDPLESANLTNWQMKGRLSLNLSIFANPNALGHNIVPCVVMLYFLFMWKRPIFAFLGTLPLLSIPLTALYHTQSKGAFLSGFGTMVLGFVFGRPIWVQVLLLALAATSGLAVVRSLPRMESLSSSDPGVQGRINAFSYGWDTIHETRTGTGYGTFYEGMLAERDFAIAAHSGYVQIGAELGFPGLTLWLAGLYMAVRTLFAARPQNEDEDRIRRTLFVLLVSFTISSWMVDFAYRPTYFLMIACAAAYHRLMMRDQRDRDLDELQRERDEQEAEDARRQEEAKRAAWAARRRGEEPVAALPGGTEGGGLAVAAAPLATTVEAVQWEQPVEVREPDPEEERQRIRDSDMPWRRIGWFDVLAVVVLINVWMRIWSYVIFRPF